MLGSSAPFARAMTSGTTSRDDTKKEYYRNILRDYIVGLYYGIILRNYITIILRNDINGLFDRIILQNHIMASHDVIIFWNYITGLYKESYQGPILRDYITQLNKRII